MENTPSSKNTNSFWNGVIFISFLALWIFLSFAKNAFKKESASPTSWTNAQSAQNTAIQTATGNQSQSQNQAQAQADALAQQQAQAQIDAQNQADALAQQQAQAQIDALAKQQAQSQANQFQFNTRSRAS